MKEKLNPLCEGCKKKCEQVWTARIIKRPNYEPKKKEK